MRKFPLFPRLRHRIAALFFAGHLLACTSATGSTEKDPSPSNHQTVQSQRNIKIALLLDTSNSMDGLIEQAKSQLWTLVNELSKAHDGDSKPELKIALYEYGNDRLNAMEGYIRLVTPLTSDLDKVSGDLFSLTTNGGSEFCGHVIQTSLKQLDWKATGEDLQVIFIAGNEEFTQGGVNYKKACLAARDSKVVVNTIYCGEFNQGVREMWKDGAELANGTYMSIEQDRKTVYIDSPYDKEILQLNNKLNDTYIQYGSQGHAKKANQMRQDANAESVAPANSVQRAVSKTKHFYKAEEWDLVDAKKEGKANFKQLDKATLPSEMKGMSEAEMEKYVDSKSKEREEVKSKIGVLNQKREAYVKEQSMKQHQSNKNMLEDVMIKAIRTQAKSKGMRFE